MGHLAERNRDVKVIHKLPGRKPEIFLGNARWRQKSCNPAAPSCTNMDEAGEAALVEDDGATAVEQDAVLGMPAHGEGEGDPLGVAADGREARRLLREKSRRRAIAAISRRSCSARRSPRRSSAAC